MQVPLGLAHTRGVPAGLAQAGVMQYPVNGGDGLGLRHQGVKRCWMDVGRLRDRGAFVAGFHGTAESFGGLLRYRCQAEVIDLCGYASLY